MRVVSIDSIPNWASNTKTMKSVGSWVGEKPHHFSQLVRLKPGLTANQLLDGLMNVYTKGDEDFKRKFEEINSFSFTWDVSTERIPKIRFAESLNDDGYGQAQVRAIMERKYYDKNDVLRLENNQLLRVHYQPQMLTHNRWQYTFTLVGNDPNRRIDTRYTQKGRTTMYMTNYQPELSEKGFTKFVFNAERHINYISCHRHSESWSAHYALLADVYTQTAASAGIKSEFLKMSGWEKRLTDAYLYSRNNNLLFGQSNFDQQGKCLDMEPDGRPIPMGDGIFTQFSRYAEHLSYLNLGTRQFNDAIQFAISKTGKSVGNTVTLVCNNRLYQHAGEALRKDALRYSPNDSAYYVNKKGEKIVVGGTFAGYTFQGNTLMLAVDDMLTEMYPDQGYGLVMDTGRGEDGVPNVSLITLPGAKMITGTMKGLGGLDGRTSGEMATPIHGSQGDIIGFSGAAVANPYGGCILRENVR